MNKRSLTALMSVVFIYGCIDPSFEFRQIEVLTTQDIELSLKGTSSDATFRLATPEVEYIFEGSITEGSLTDSESASATFEGELRDESQDVEQTFNLFRNQLNNVWSCKECLTYIDTFAAVERVPKS